MSVSHISALAKKHGVSTNKAEGHWTKAKAVAVKEGKGDNYAYITSIFKSMLNEAAYIPSLKDLTNGMSFRYYLVAEDDSSQSTKQRSAAWTHLEKFPQFNELPFRARRELEQEAQELVAGFNELDPEEQSSVDDHLLDLVIDKMQEIHGTGVNVGDWSATDHSDDEPADDELYPDSGAVTVTEPRRKERAPSHIAAMRSRHLPVNEPISAEEPRERSTGGGKSYYKPWSALSDEQRAGRAKLASKHGRIYRFKQTAAYRAMSPDQQVQAIEKLKNGGSLREALDWNDMKKNVNPKEMRNRVIKGGGNPFKNRIQKRFSKK
jgi:hypothetical protein